MKTIKIILISIVLLVGLCGCTDSQINENSVSENVNQEEIIVVTDKWVKRTEDRDLYMIGTENEVFKIEDNAFIFKFNSSDIYNQIKIGQKYKITTTGVRNNFMSWYRNINTIELVEGE